MRAVVRLKEQQAGCCGVRTGDVITISGVVTHSLHDDYDHSWQPGAEGALALQEFRGAKPFLFATEWRQPVTAVVPVKGRRLGQPKVAWGKISE